MSGLAAFLLGVTVGVVAMTLVAMATIAFHYRREWREEELRFAQRAGRDSA